MTIRRHFCRAAIASVALATTTLAAAEAWPSKPIRIVVPGAPGSVPDVAMRMIGARISALLGQSVVIDNKVGAGGIVALRALQASKDDHTFLMAITGTSAISPVTFRNLAGFNYARDLQPVAQMAQTSVMIVTQQDSDANSLGDVMKLAREKPAQVSFATPSPNTLANLAIRLLEQKGNVRFNIVPFSRTSDSLGAVSGGDAKFYADGISAPLPLVRNNRLKVLAVLSHTRLPGLEAYPLGNETVPGLEAIGRFGLVALKETPADVVAAMSKATVNASGDPEVAARLKEFAFFPLPEPAARYRVSLQQEADLWARVVREAGIQPE